jgi:hydrogenase expression/formation protein HypD
MKLHKKYRQREPCLKVAQAIKLKSSKPITLMEVCGGHTTALQKYGIPSLLPDTIHLVSGPGCPVCVTDKKFIDHIVALSRLDDIVITTFGDLIRVPGSTSSLEKEKAHGADIRIVYSPLEALAIAKKNPDKKIVFPGIGFETTAPTTAAAVLEACETEMRNFYLLGSHKVMPPAMAALIHEGVKIDGYMCPGHVSVITGSGIYYPIVEQFKKGCVISGFEPLDILLSIYMLVKQFEERKPAVEIEYTRAVRPEGNKKALAVIDKVYQTCDAWWRGLGIIPQSGLELRDEYAAFDAGKEIDVEVEETKEVSGCICGEILKGAKSAQDCRLFKKVCTPTNPVGACMVSGEGACAAFYRYGG